MTKQPQTEEQKHARSILARWLKVERTLGWGFNVLFYALLAYLIIRSMRGDFARLVFIVCAAGVCRVFYAGMRARMIERFARHLTADDETALKNALIDDAISDKETAKEILTEIKKLDAKKVLLRASSPNENEDILLRPCTHNADTPQEQLLRASHTSEQ